ncbi:MAG: hypothetical protein AAF914_06380 [Pseudomonadota bacterium]
MSDIDISKSEGKSVTVARGRGYYGMARKLVIYVDQAEVGRLKRGETLTLQNLPDSAVIQGGMDWGRTEPVTVSTLSDGATIEMTGRFTLNVLRNVGITYLPFRITIR